jgi:CheY-like chemotaxis protein
VFRKAENRLRRHPPRIPPNAFWWLTPTATFACFMPMPCLIPASRSILSRTAPPAGKRLQTRDYSLLITENDLPNLTGVQLITKLRAAKMALPVVMAAARLPVHDLAQNPSLQLAATLAKPFAIDVLRATVKIASSAGGNLGPKPNVCVGIS